MLVYEFVGTFHFYWKQPIEPIDIICDICPQWIYTFFELNLPYSILHY